jgi:hypothetical protein
MHIEKDQLIKFLHSTYKQQNIPFILCKLCDCPSSKNHQQIWCDNCPGEMVDRSNWIILNTVARLENSHVHSKRFRDWPWRNLLCSIWYYILGGSTEAFDFIYQKNIIQEIRNIYEEEKKKLNL